MTNPKLQWLYDLHAEVTDRFALNQQREGDPTLLANVRNTLDVIEDFTAERRATVDAFAEQARDLGEIMEMVVELRTRLRERDEAEQNPAGPEKDWDRP
jgi:hypothetical protein